MTEIQFFPIDFQSTLFVSKEAGENEMYFWSSLYGFQFNLLVPFMSGFHNMELKCEKNNGVLIV